MPIKDYLMPWQHRETLVRDSMVVGLTPLGTTKAEQYTAVGPQFEVMSVLKDRGFMNLRELSEATRMNIKKVRAIVQELINSHYARRITGNEPPSQ